MFILYQFVFISEGLSVAKNCINSNNEIKETAKKCLSKKYIPVIMNSYTCIFKQNCNIKVDYKFKYLEISFLIFENDILRVIVSFINKHSKTKNLVHNISTEFDHG